MRKILLLLILFNFYSFLFAQRESTNHFFHYVPVSHNYLTMLIAPGTLGPNALPIPDMLNGKVGTDSQFEFSIDNYFRDGGGDQGHTFQVDFRFPVVQNFMALGVEWRVVDYFHTTNEVRDIIQIYKDDPGWTNDVGDLIIKMYIQLFHDRKYWPDMMLVISLKNTTGSIHDGRYTDLPAHWHYLSLGKTLLNSRNVKLRLNGMGGYYFWQTNQIDLEQNEGPLWGLETQFNLKKLELAGGLSGYKGWKYYGQDRPIQFKGRIIFANQQLNYFAEYKTGLRDYYYSSVTIGVNWHPTSPFKLQD